MKTKHAELVAQLECVTVAYEAALAAARTLEAVVGGQPDVLGVAGGINYYDAFENTRAIHISPYVFTDAALECGYGFSHETQEGTDYTRVECTLFGRRVFALVDKNSEEEAYLLMREAAEAKENE